MMGDMKSILLTISVWLALGTMAAQAQTQDEDQQLRHFAACAGRLSAVMEHQWMFDGQASEVTKSQRAAMLELVEAIMPKSQGRAVLHWRLSAKLAQSSLLTRATFNDDPRDAAWATETAAQFTRDCTSILLS